MCIISVECICRHKLEKELSLPSQLVIYMEVELNTAGMRVRLSQQRGEALTALLYRVTPHNAVRALSVMQLLGMMSVGHMVIPLGLLHMRRLQSPRASGWSAFSATSEHSQTAAALGSVVRCSVYTWCTEQRGGHYVERKSSPGGLEPPS